MSGFYLGRNGNPIEKASQNSATLGLLARGDGIEIMLYEIEPDKVIQIAPGGRKETMEFFYILEGEVNWMREHDQIPLRAGDYFYIHFLTEQEYVKTATYTKMLYVSTQPIFHYLSNKINDLMAMVKSVEEKDYYTHSHGQRVQDYARKISEHLTLSQQSIDRLLFASLFHDIGKVEMPDEILAGKNRPSSKEWKIIKKHPTQGKKIVENTFLRNIGDVIEQHHERIDGSGYPYGLMDKDICLEAKIIAVVDAFDAMTSDRPYHKGLSAAEAVKELKRLAGKQFDKKIVDIFVTVLKDEGLIS